MKINQIIYKPVLTEKSTNVLKNNFFMFEVDKKATKPQIKQALEKLYPVKVDKIKSAVRKGKIKKVGRRQKERHLADRKIVFIKLKEGKIDLFPQA